MAYVDPRGPLRAVVSSQFTTQAYLVTVECGHTVRQVTHMAAPEPGEHVRCLHCLITDEMATRYPEV